MAASSPDTIYVGSGESTLRDSVGYGNGMYKSTDAGRTWTHIGLDDTQHIGKVAVDPRNPNIVFVAAIGHLYDAHPARGVFRSQDGGRTWQKVLFKNDSVGAVDVVIDPTNSQVVYASLWNTRRPTWYTYQPTNGPGGGIYKSTNGGTTWTQLTNGLPTECVGRSGLAVSASNPRRVYAVVDDFLPEGAPAGTPCPGTPSGRGAGAAQARPPAEPRRTAGAAARRLLSIRRRRRDVDEDVRRHRALGPRLVLREGRGRSEERRTSSMCRTCRCRDRRTAARRGSPLRGSPGGDDYHQAWVSPDDSNTIIVASDQGTVITRNALTEDPRDVTWSSWLNQPIAQIYHVSADYRFPYWVTGAQQDSGAVAVRTRGKFAGISMRDWEPIGAGGESGMTAADPLHPGIVFGGTGSRCDLDLNLAAGATRAPQGPEPARTDWTQPLVFSKADPNALYYANQFLFKTTDDAQTWKVISPDLTRPDPGIPANLDEVAAKDTDRNGTRGVIYAVSPSPLRAPLLWIGTDDGLIQVTPDDGGTWKNVTPPALTPWSRVTGVEASHFDAERSVRVRRSTPAHGFRSAHLSHARPGRQTWQEITRGLPAGVYVHVVKEDPARRGLLFCRHRARRVPVVRRRRSLAVAATESARHVDARSARCMATT